MRQAMLRGLPLVCPACQARGIPAAAAPRLQHVPDAPGEPGADEGAAAPASGELVCPAPDCGTHFPVLDGLPLLHPTPDAFMAAEMPALTGELDLGAGRGLDFLSAYTWAAWADRLPADPDPETADLHAHACTYRATLDEGLAELADAATRLGNGAPLLDAGCGIGRETRELAARYAGPVLGFDLRAETLRLAEAVEENGSAAWFERRPGRPSIWHPLDPPPGPGRAGFLVADAACPPLPPSSCAGIVACNLLDSTSEPRTVLATLAALLQPGALLLVTTPFSWSAPLGQGEGWPLGEGEDDEQVLLAELARCGLRPRRPPRPLRWVLRRHAREWVEFFCRMVVAVKR